MHGWVEVKEAAMADAKADAYQATVMAAMDFFFPLRTVKKKSTDPPWMDKKTASMVEDRKRLYVEEGGRTEAWKLEKKKTNDRVKERKQRCFDKQKEQLLAEDANQIFFINK